MGYSSYSSISRSVRATASGYYSKGRDELFTQQKEMKAHKDMMPTDVSLRVCGDSEAHPNTVPVQLYLDVTGSMGHIPHDLIKDGLPKMIGRLIQNGVPDVSMMFGAIGDHECDQYPLQVGQFESGDEELDMWLTRTYLEGCGGGNMGESYPLAWYFAGNHVQHDCFDLRKKKGFVITIGDEPFLPTYPQSAIKEIMGSTCAVQSTMTAEELFEEASKKNHVFHIHINHGSRRCSDAWKQLLGKNLIETDDYTKLPDIISKLVLNTLGQEPKNEEFIASADTASNEETASDEAPSADKPSVDML